MITIREIVYALAGVIRLAKHDTGGLAYFDDSVRGFWRSFYAALLVAPVYAVILILDSADRTITISLPAVILTEAIAYVIRMVALPLAAFYITEIIDRRDHFIRFVIANNWSGVLQAFVLFPAVLLSASGIFPDVLSSIVLSVISLWILYFQWYIARHALDVVPPIAVGIVVLDLVIGISVGGLAHAIEA